MGDGDALRCVRSMGRGDGSAAQCGRLPTACAAAVAAAVAFFNHIAQHGSHCCPSLHGKPAGWASACLRTPLCCCQSQPWLQGEPAGTSSRTPPAVVELMEADHHAFMLKKMGAWVGVGGAADSSHAERVLCDGQLGVVELMGAGHHAFKLKKMGAWNVVLNRVCFFSRFSNSWLAGC